MPDLSHPPAPVLFRGKNPGLTEIGTLLGLLPGAALILDRSRETVVVANAELMKLTAYSQAELSGALAVDLLQGIIISQLTAGQETPVQLRRHKRDPLPVMMQVVALDHPVSQWLLLRLTPVDALMQDIASKQEALLQWTQELGRLIEEPDLDHALHKALVISSAFFDTNLVCVYQADGEFPRLNKVASTETDVVFPETIPSSDLARLSKTTVWIPGKRVQTEVHKFGRIANLCYVASTPLGQEKALFGLLVVGDTGREPADWMPTITEILGAHLHVAIQHYILSTNLTQAIENHQRLLTTHTSVFENSQEGIVILTPDLVIQDINPAAEWMLGYANWEAQGLSVENILIGPERLIPALDSAVLGIPTHNIGNVSLHRRNGQSFPAHMQTIPVQKDNKLLAVIIFLADVSAHEQIRERTQQLEHRAILGDVTAVFAHEVRNPINNISSGLQWMSSKLESGDPQLDIINRMEADCTRLNHLMESVLSFSRPMEHKFEPIDLSILLQRLMDRWRPRLARVNVEPLFQSEENLPRILGDARALEQVFTNLISNAVEAMSKTGGTLAMRISRLESSASLPQIEVTVSDNGPGIPEEILERMFEAFVTNKLHGTGLGLAITKRIVTAHHGSIHVDSFPGGTVFHVCLPINQGES